MTTTILIIALAIAAWIVIGSINYTAWNLLTGTASRYSRWEEQQPQPRRDLLVVLGPVGTLALSIIAIHLGFLYLLNYIKCLIK
ncbi:hypothetical protein BH10CYA1_BH10CYA1_32400 [soil metagenome]